MLIFKRSTKEIPELVYEKRSDGVSTVHKLKCDRWYLTFTSEEVFACCGTQQICGFEIRNSNDHMLIKELSTNDFVEIKKWLKEYVPMHGMHTFMIAPIWECKDSYDGVMIEIYNILSALGTVVSRFENVNSGNDLRLIQFTPEEDIPF